jgi:DNA processing protein
VALARRNARLALLRLQALGGRLVALADAEYPNALGDLPDPPPLLTVRGGPIPSGGNAIIGTRTPSAAGVAMAGAFARRSTPPIVSGLARGIDAAAHRAALAAGAAQVAYVGHGFGATYPPEHRDLEEAIVRGGGVVVSERLVGEPATRWSLVRRDRLQAAHARACVLVESEIGGGAMHTMRFAAALLRPRYALEPRVGDPITRGNARAIRDGAQPLPWEVNDAAAQL